MPRLSEQTDRPTDRPTDREPKNRLHIFCLTLGVGQVEGKVELAAEARVHGLAVRESEEAEGALVAARAKPPRQPLQRPRAHPSVGRAQPTGHYLREFRELRELRCGAPIRLAQNPLRVVFID